MQIILHVGMHKTGTTVIQNTIGSGIPGLSVLECGYDHNNGRSFEAAFKQKKNAIEIETQKFLLKKINKQILDSKEKKFLISGERISLANESTLRRFYEFASPLCDSIKVVGYVRPPHSFMQSNFQQRLKGGLAGSWYDFNPEDWYGNYRKRFRNYDLIFGKENVSIRMYDRKFLLHSDIIADFCNTIDVKPPAHKLIDSNQSLSLEAVSLLYVLRRFGSQINHESTADTRLEKEVISEISKIGSRRFSISNDITRPIINRNRSDISWIENRIGKPFVENTQDSPESVKSEADLIEIAMNLCPTVLHDLSISYEGLIMTPEDLGLALSSLRNKIKSTRNSAKNTTISKTMRIIRKLLIAR